MVTVMVAYVLATPLVRVIVLSLAKLLAIRLQRPLPNHCYLHHLRRLLLVLHQTPHHQILARRGLRHLQAPLLAVDFVFASVRAWGGTVHPRVSHEHP